MLMVMPFSSCVARPDDGDTKFLLRDHLIEVANSAGDFHGSSEDKLMFLAGLLHDAGKAQTTWQQYIRGQKKGGPNHSPLGSLSFTFYATELLKKWSLMDDKLRWFVQNLATDIASHHGDIKDIEESLPWRGKVTSTDLASVDWQGVHNLVVEFFPEAKDIEIANLWSWNKAFKNTWHKWVLVSRGQRKREVAFDISLSAMCILREYTSRLITADRFHAGAISPSYLSSLQAQEALSKVDEYISDLSSDYPQEISALRQDIQDRTISNYLENVNHSLYTLSLPTGYGKTLTSLKIALHACKEKKRIIYVAPYLSILSQTTREISRATGLDVMEHHHLAWVGMREDKDVLATESWQASVVTTTFNQFFRALFPEKAQQTLRLSGLRDAVVIIDEPQVIDGKVWNGFLRLLEVTTKRLNTEVLIITATMPPLNYGLETKPLELAPKVPQNSRYEIHYHKDPWNEEELKDRIVMSLQTVSKIAVIVNTINDSTIIYKGLEDLREDSIKVYHLHGSMTPLHKALRIKEISTSLKQKSPVVVVSTQVIEAGVDFSFDVIYRATPIFSSIVQAAGRANRHGEKGQGKVEVFHSIFGDKPESRKYVYREAIAREETDKILAEHPHIMEDQVALLTANYYKQIFMRNNHRQVEESIINAAMGAWSEVAGLSPYEKTYMKLSMFVPFGTEYLLTEEAEDIRNLMDKFQIDNIDKIYERYEDRQWVNKLSFLERKQFNSLLEQFIVPVSSKVATSFSRGMTELGIIHILDMEYYSSESGMAKLQTEDETFML